MAGSKQLWEKPVSLHEMWYNYFDFVEVRLWVDFNSFFRPWKRRRPLESTYLPGPCRVTSWPINYLYIETVWLWHLFQKTRRLFQWLCQATTGADLFLPLLLLFWKGTLVQPCHGLEIPKYLSRLLAWQAILHHKESGLPDLSFAGADPFTLVV